MKEEKNGNVVFLHLLSCGKQILLRYFHNYLYKYTFKMSLFMLPSELAGSTNDRKKQVKQEHKCKRHPSVYICTTPCIFKRKICSSLHNAITAFHTTPSEWYNTINSHQLVWLITWTGFIFFQKYLPHRTYSYRTKIYHKIFLSLTTIHFLHHFLIKVIFKWLCHCCLKKVEKKTLRQPHHTICTKMPLIKLLPVSEMMTRKKGKEKFHNEHFTEHQTFPEHASPTQRNGGKPNLIKVNGCFAVVFHTHKISKVSKSIHNPCFFLSLHEFSVARYVMSSAAITLWKTMEEGRANVPHEFIQSWSLLSPRDFFWLKKPT